MQIWVRQCEIRVDAICFAIDVFQATFTILKPVRVLPVRWGLFLQPEVQVCLCSIFILHNMMNSLVCFVMKYMIYLRAGACTVCAVGYYADTTASTVCKICATGIHHLFLSGFRHIHTKISSLEVLSNTYPVTNMK